MRIIANYLLLVILAANSIFAFAASLEIDVQATENLRNKNPNDTASRMLLARHYIEKDQFSKAEIYIDEVLAINPSQKQAKQIKKQIIASTTSSTLLKTLAITAPYTKKKLSTAIINLHTKQKYSEQIEVYQLAQVSNIPLSDEALIVTARFFVWDGQYEEASGALKLVSLKNSVSYLEENVKLCSLTQNYDCAIRSANTLYKATRDQKYGLQLLKLYLQAGRYNEAEKFFYTLKAKKTKTQGLDEFEKEIGQITSKRLEALEKAYKAKPTLESFLPYIGALSEYGKKNKAKLLIEEYLAARPKEPKEHLLLASRLSWMGFNDRAIGILTNLLPSENKIIYLRLAEIHAWSGHFNKAVDLLKPLSDNDDKSIAVDATRTLAYTYLWNGYSEKAKYYFNKTLSISPDDVAAKEELMILNKDIEPLLKKYLAKHKANSSDVDTIRKLASFYQILGNKSKAKFYLEKLNKLQPGNLGTQKELGEVLVSDKQHYRGFGLLEQYAYQKNTAEALHYLAQQYYWAGFNDEALDVLDDLLRQYPDDRRAYALKSEILKINPRFVSDKKSQNNWLKYETDKGKKQLELADRLYFSEFYKSSVPYYQAHLKIKPEDFDARYRYAFALQRAKMHEEAAGEFFLMFWQKKDAELRYYYAYNLEKMGRHDEARTEYLAVLAEKPAETPDFLISFLAGWKSAWESQNIDVYSRYYDKQLTKSASWRIRKELSFKNSSFIAVAIKDPKVTKQKNRKYRIRFFQEFASNRLKDTGYKTLNITCRGQSCYITRERWTAGDYNPTEDSFFGYVEERLAGLDSKDGKFVNKQMAMQPAAVIQKQSVSETPVDPTIDYNDPRITATTFGAVVPTPITVVRTNPAVPAVVKTNPATPINIANTSQDPKVLAIQSKLSVLEAQLAQQQSQGLKRQEIQKLENLQPVIDEQEKRRLMMIEFDNLDKQANPSPTVSPAPVLRQTAPVSAQTAPVLAQTAPVLAQTAPITSQQDAQLIALQNKLTKLEIQLAQQAEQDLKRQEMQKIKNLQPVVSEQEKKRLMMAEFAPLNKQANPTREYPARTQINNAQAQQHFNYQKPIAPPPPPQILKQVERVVIVGYDIYHQPIYNTQKVFQAVPNPAYKEYLDKQMNQQPARQPFGQPQYLQQGTYPQGQKPIQQQFTQGGYPQQQGVYPQQQGIYPQQQGIYPQQQGIYPQQQGINSQQSSYPRGQNGYQQNQLPPMQFSQPKPYVQPQSGGGWPTPINNIQQDTTPYKLLPESEQKKKGPIIALPNFYRPHELSLDWFNYRDVNDVALDKLTLGYAYQLNEKITLSASAFIFRLKDNIGKDDGNGFELAASGKNFTIGGRLQSLRNYDVISPFASYTMGIGEHSVGIKAERTALPLKKYSVCSGQNKLHSTQLTVSDYTDWEDGSNFWGSIEFSKINDDVKNQVITPQFDYQFYYKNWGALSSNLTVSGWYQFNSDPNNCYYSPDFVDATLFGANAGYYLNDTWQVKGKAKVGYSSTDKATLFQAGLWLEQELEESIGILLGCFISNSIGQGSTGGAYLYRECRANLRYQF